MEMWALMTRLLGKGTKYLFLIAFASFSGAVLGSLVGHMIGELRGSGSWPEQAAWIAHGRCVGWTLFALIAVVGAPFGFVSYCDEPPPFDRNETTAPERHTTQGGIKAIVGGISVGAVMGLILGLVLSVKLGVFLVILYGFVAFSPLGPDGWWPILAPMFRSIHDAIPFTLVSWLIVLGCLVLLGAILGPFGTTSVGNRRFQTFRSHED